MSILGSRLEQCMGQELLDLSHIALNDEKDAKKVAKSITANSYIDVDLSLCEITSQTLRILSSSLRKNHQLQYLFLNDNKIDPSGIVVIIDILRGNKNIESINLRGNQLFSAEMNAAEAGDDEDQSDIEELVETCCELQSLKSVCGCGEFYQEMVVNTTESYSGLYSDVLLLGIELKLGVDLTSLQYWGSVGLSEVFEALKDNRTVLHAQFSRFQSSTVDFSLPLITFLQNNSTMKSLQFAFDHHDPSATAGYSKLQKLLSSGKNTLLCMLRSLENNVSVSSLQLDAWVRDSETMLALTALVRKNDTLLHLTLFGSSLRVEDLVLLAHSLEYNRSLRVLCLNKAAYIADQASAANRSKSKPPPGGNLLLAPEVKARFEASAKARKLPFLVRTEDEDYIFGPAHLMSVPAALQWEIGDTVEVRVDLDHLDVHVTPEPVNGVEKEGDATVEEEVWVAGTVWAVYADQRYTIKIDATGEVKFSIKASLVRAGESFRRLKELNRTEPAATTAHVTTRSRLASTEDAHSTSSNVAGDSQLQQSVVYPVVYIPGQAVEVRYLGDAEWLPAVVVAAAEAQPSAVVTVAVELPLESVLEVLINSKGSKNKDIHKLSDAPSWQSELVTVRDTVEMETCFVRPAVPSPLYGHEHILYYSQERDEVLRSLGSKPFYDAGAFLRGDYVEVRLFVSNLSPQSSSEASYEWKRGRVALDRKNGTYDVRMENGVDLAGIRGCHLRHHFRPRDVVDCRHSHVTLSPGDVRPVLPELHEPVDKQTDPSQESLTNQTSFHPLHRSGLQPHQLQQVLLPPRSTWVTALVLKQDRSGLFAVSLEDASNVKNVASARLMPANRPAVRKTAQELRVIAQSWPLVQNTVRSEVPEEEDSSELSAIAHKPAMLADSPVRQPSVGLSPVLSFNSNVETLSTVEEGVVEQPSVVEVAVIHTEKEVAQVTNVLQSWLSLTNPSAASELVRVNSAPPKPQEVSRDALASGARSISPFRAVSAPMRPLVSAFDINDRVEVRRDGDVAWFAGRIEGIHPDNTTYFVRFVDGTTDGAVSLQHIRRVNATPARAGAKIVDRGATSPVPQSASKGASVTFGAHPASEARINGEEPFPKAVAGNNKKKADVATPPTKQRKTQEADVEAEAAMEVPDEAQIKPVPPTSPLPAIRPEPLSATNTVVAANAKSEYFRPENVLNDVSDTPWVGKQLFPPYKSPEPARSTPPLHVDIRVGAWLNIFNATLKEFEPCEVEVVYPEEGLFDACNRRGELYRRIDARYIDPDAPLAAEEAPTSHPVPNVPHNSPRHGGAPLSVTYSAQKPVQSAQMLPVPSHTHHDSNLDRTYRIGAKVHAQVQGAWVAAVVVKRLTPEVYTVYLEDFDEESTMSVSRLRSADYEGASFDPHTNFAGQKFDFPPSRQHFIQDNDGAGRGVEYPYGEFGGDGSLDGSLDDDELVVVGTGLNEGISMGLLGSADNSVVEGLDQRAYVREHDHGVRPFRHEEAVSYGERVQVDETRRPHTAPHPPTMAKSSAANRTERSSSANRQDKYSSNHHHQQQKESNYDHSHRSASPQPFQTQDAFVHDESPFPSLSQKPVSVSARLSAGDLQLAVPEETLPLEGPEVFQSEFGVAYRSHCAPLSWIPLVAYLHQDASISPLEAFRDGTEVTVVPFSDHAQFGDAMHRTSYSFTYRRDAAMNTNSVLLSMQVQSSASDACPVKISFYVNAIVVAEVCFVVITNSGEAQNRGSKSRAGRAPNSSPRGPDRVRAQALAALCVWRRSVVSPFQSVCVFCCEVPQHSTANVESVESRLGIVAAELESSVILLPPSMVVTVASTEEELGRAGPSANRLQVFVVSSSDEQLTREKWLAVLANNSTLSDIVKAAIAEFRASAGSEELSSFYLDKLVLSIFCKNETGDEHRDWLFSVGLSPFNLDNTAPFFDHALSRALWSFDPQSAEGAALTLKVRFCSTQKAVCRLLAQFSANYPQLLPLNVLLVPSVLAKFGFGAENVRLRGEQVTAALQNALTALFTKQEVRQHNETHSEGEARHALFLHTIGETLSRDAKSVPLAISAQVSASQAFALAPLLKALTALSIAHAVADKVDAPSGSAPYSVHIVASSLQLEGLLALHDFYAHIEGVFIDTRFAAGPSSSAALTLYPIMAPNSAEQLLESAVSHLENALLSLQQHDLTRAASALQLLLGSGISSDARIVRVGSVSHFVDGAEFQRSWTSLAEISPFVSSDTPHNWFETHRPDCSVVPADSAEDRYEMCALSPYRASGPAESPLRGSSNSPTRSPGATKTVLEAQFAQLITQQAGVKDSFSAHEAAGCLIAMGCSTSADFTSMGSLFNRADGRTDVEKLRLFLHEGGIPLFIAAKLAVYVANQSAH